MTCGVTRIPPALALRLTGKDSFTVAMAVIEEQSARIEVLGAEKRALQTEKGAQAAEIRTQAARIESLEAENRNLQAKLAELQAKAGRPAKTPKNSSVPPSRAAKPNGEVGAKPKPKQRVHPGAWRRLCDNPTRVEDVQAQACPHCQADVSGVAQVAAETYDHVEIPLAPAEVTRVVLRGGTCPCCQKTFKAPPPPDKQPGSPYGPNLRAAVLYLRHAHAVSYERLAALLETQFGAKLSEGALASILVAAAPAFAVQFGMIRRRLLEGSVICSDETGFRVGKQNNWIWVFQHGDCCCFVSAPTRGKVVVAEFLGGVRPLVWVSDRLTSQAGWADKHQACLAHLLRDAEYALDCGDTILAARVMSLLCRSMRVWRYRERLERRFGPGVLAAFFWRHFIELDELLATPVADNKAGEKLRRSLLRDREKLFVFLVERDVPPTNNSSEQALRWSAVFRKVTNCFRSLWGAKLHADVRSVIETARRRGIGALEAIRLTLQGLPLPIPA
jgi:transposase